MKKKIIKTLLAIALAVSLLVAVNLVANAETEGDYTYTVYNGNATITGYTGVGGDVAIPSTLGGYPVTSIGMKAFRDCTSLTSIDIPDGVTKIENGTFMSCESLTSIKIPDGVISIGYRAFSGCESLTSIDIPDGVTSIGDNTFYECESLESVSIPDGVTIIGSHAFYDCKSLESIDIPDGVTSIGEYAFDGCILLTSIDIPDGVTEIGEYAFARCTLLESLEIPDRVTKIGDRAFYGCESLTSIDIPEGVTSIGKEAFVACRLITSITIPDGVTKIGDSAFANCTSLTSITIPDGVTKIGNSAFAYCTSLTRIDIPDTVTSIGREVFNYYCKLEEVYYGGTQEEWNNIKIGSDNSYLTNATIYFAVKIRDEHINYRLRCTTEVVDGNLVLTADTAGTSSMKIRLGNLPEGATLHFFHESANASLENGILTVKNTGLGRVEVPMIIISAEGIVSDFVLVGDFGNAIRYATYARLSQTGNDITITSGAATAYVLFDTTEIDGGYVEVENVSRNLLGRHVVSGSAVRFYNPVYDEGTVTVNVKNANGETVETYNVTTIFADATDYTVVLDTSLRCTYEVDGDNITVTANAGVSNVYLNFGRYYSESLSASVNDDIIKKMGARSWRIMKSDEPVEFDLYFDATAYGAETVTRHVTVNF